MIFSDFAKALAQIGDPRFRRVLLLGLGLTIALLIAAYAGLIGLLQYLDPASFDLPFFGPNAFVGGLLSLGSLALMLVLSIVLMIPVASAITSLFLDDVADAVEARHYPDLAPTPRAGFFDGLRDTVSFLGLMVFVNVVALVLLPLYWFIAPLVFYAINGYLIGREYFILAAARRIGLEGAHALRRKHGLQIWTAGVFMAIPLTFPLLNLIMPVLGAAAFTHLYHRLATRARPPAAIPASPSG